MARPQAVPRAAPAPQPCEFRKTPMTHFEGIVPPLATALEKRGYTDLTPVQIAMLAPELAGADALVSAQTGSGKTVAFGIALAPTLLDGADKFTYVPAPLALIVTPTRELAMQVQRELQWLYAETGANIASCVGGMDYRTEKRALDRGAHIVVGTPGRLRDHIERGSLDMTGLRAAVLDEADEMLDLGFREDLEFILQSAPEDRRTLMFSATVSKPIATLAQSYQRGAIRVATAGERRQHVDIDYRALQVATADRENAIINVLRFYEAKNALVFCSTRAAVNHLMARFNKRGFAVVALSGELSQNERTHALQAMRDGRARVCIATDVAARGLDLPGLELVIHADLPGNRETLLHRSGRTGRAGNKGVSALIVEPRDRKKAERLLAAAAITATWAKPPSADEVTARDTERMLALPLLLEPLTEDEAPLAARILGQHNPDQIAAAFLRLWREGRSAPEELRDAAGPDGKGEPRRDRAEFGPSVWIALSVGRSQNAEPRWLLPMLCTAGGITKTAIGAIRMLDDETHVQLAAPAAPGFLAAVGAEMTLEKGIRLRVMDDAPADHGSARPAAPPEPRREDRHEARHETQHEARHETRHEAPAPRRPAKRDGEPAPRHPAKDHIPKDHATAEPAPPAPRPKPAPVPDRPAAPERVAATAKRPYVSKKPDADQSARPRETVAAETPDPSPHHRDPTAARPAAHAAKKPYKSRSNDAGPKPWADRPAKGDGATAYKSGGYKSAATKPGAKPGTRPAFGKPAYAKAKPAFDPKDPSASRRKPGTKPAFGKAPRPTTDTPRRPKPKG